MTGGKATFDYPALPVPPNNYKYRVHSVQLPVMMVLKTGDEEHERFFAGVGFYLARNLGGQLHEQLATGTSGSSSLNLQWQLRDDKKSLQFDGPELNSIKRFDFGLNFGLGYHMAAGPELYFFYQKGTVDMLSHTYIGKSTTYQLGIAARYALKWSPKHTHSNKYVNHK